MRAEVLVNDKDCSCFTWKLEYSSLRITRWNADDRVITRSLEEKNSILLLRVVSTHLEKYVTMLLIKTW